MWVERLINWRCQGRCGRARSRRWFSLTICRLLSQCSGSPGCHAIDRTSCCWLCHVMPWISMAFWSSGFGFRFFAVKNLCCSETQLLDQWWDPTSWWCLRGPCCNGWCLQLRKMQGSNSISSSARSLSQVDGEQDFSEDFLQFQWPKPSLLSTSFPFF